jgi:hypothetical protein
MIIMIIMKEDWMIAAQLMLLGFSNKRGFLGSGI